MSGTTTLPYATPEQTADDRRKCSDCRWHKMGICHAAPRLQRRMGEWVPVNYQPVPGLPRRCPEWKGVARP